MRVEIDKLHRRLGATMIFVTHDQVEAMTLADRIVVLRNGVIEQVGTPLELYNKPANVFVAGFIGSPRMNLLPGRIGASTATTPRSTSITASGCAPIFPSRRSRGRRSRWACGPSIWCRRRRARGCCTARCRSPSNWAARPMSTLTLPGGQSVTVEIKGQAAVDSGAAMELAFADGKFHVFGPDERVMRHA